MNLRCRRRGGEAKRRKRIVLVRLSVCPPVRLSRRTRRPFALPAAEDLAETARSDEGTAGFDGLVDRGGEPGPTGREIRAGLVAGGGREPLGETAQELTLGRGRAPSIRVLEGADRGRFAARVLRGG